MAPRRNGQHQNHPRPDPVERAEQAYQIVQYKREGKTFPWIAEQMQMSMSTAHHLFGIGIKLMAPPKAKHELALQFLQLEQLYSDIMDDLARTTDPAEKAKLYAQAHSNLAARKELVGGADLTVAQSMKGKIRRDMKDLVMKIDDDQEVRNASRARARKNGKL